MTRIRKPHSAPAAKNMREFMDGVADSVGKSMMVTEMARRRGQLGEVDAPAAVAARYAVTLVRRVNLTPAKMMEPVFAATVMPYLEQVLTLPETHDCMVCGQQFTEGTQIGAVAVGYPKSDGGGTARTKMPVLTWALCPLCAAMTDDELGRAIMADIEAMAGVISAGVTDMEVEGNG
jgi:hypothetical protein